MQYPKELLDWLEIDVWHRYPDDPSGFNVEIAVAFAYGFESMLEQNINQVWPDCFWCRGRRRRVHFGVAG